YPLAAQLLPHLFNLGFRLIERARVVYDPVGYRTALRIGSLGGDTGLGVLGCHPTSVDQTFQPGVVIGVHDDDAVEILRLARFDWQRNVLDANGRLTVSSARPFALLVGFRKR